MIPSGLLIFLVVGMIGGAVAVFVLNDVRSDSEIEFVSGYSLHIQTDKTEYTRGEPVTITVTNNGDELITFSDLCRGLSISGLLGPPYVYPGTCGEETVPFEPEQSYVEVWDQKNSEGEQVFDGAYKASVNSGTTSASTVFHIYESDLTSGS